MTTLSIVLVQLSTVAETLLHSKRVLEYRVEHVFTKGGQVFHKVERIVKRKEEGTIH